MVRPVAARVKALLNEFIGVLRSGVWILEGEESAGKEPLKMFFAGSEAQKSHLSELAFGGTCREQNLGKLYFWKILYLLFTNRSRCNIAIIEGSRLHRYLYKHSGDFFMPIWIKSEVSIPLEAVSKSCKSDLARIRRCNLSYEIAKEAARVDDFYHSIYRPAVNRSHGESAIEIDYETMMRMLNQGKCVLLLIMKEGITISGVLIILSATPRLWAAGVVDDGHSYQKECGAYGAIYHFASEYLSEQGYPAMHLGMSRSFLNDGILQFKNKWNHRVMGYDSSGFVLKILRASEGADDFLINNPFACLEDEKLYSMVFLQRDAEYSDKSYQRLRKRYFLAGFSGLSVFRQGTQAGDFSKVV